MVLVIRTTVGWLCSVIAVPRPMTHTRWPTSAHSATSCTALPSSGGWRGRAGAGPGGARRGWSVLLVVPAGGDDLDVAGEPAVGALGVHADAQRAGQAGAGAAGGGAGRGQHAALGVALAGRGGLEIGRAHVRTPVR